MPKDPYRYFRVEARELLEGLRAGVLALDRGGAVDEIGPALLRQAHTLKGAARVVRHAAIAELSHTFEDEVQRAQGAAATGASSRLGELLASLGEQVEALGATASGASAAAGAASSTPPHPSPLVVEAAPPSTAPRGKAGLPRIPLDDAVPTVRVDVAEIDALVRSTAEASAHVAELRGALTLLADARRLAAGLAHEPSRDALTDTLDRLEHEAGAVVDRAERGLVTTRDRARRLRLAPLETVLEVLELAARDAARAVGRPIVFEAAFGDARLDAPVLAALRGAFLHVVRNAVVHGSEDEATRRAAGKPPALTVRVEAARRGSRIAVSCSDDGAGIDVESVRRVAVAGGLVTAAEAAALPERDALRLVLEGGVTTAPAVTTEAGRGVGLDVLAAAARQLGGEVDIRSLRGHGTRVEVVVPVTLSSLRALVVEEAGVTASIPLEGVRGTFLLSRGDVAAAASGELVRHEGRALPLLALSDLLGLDAEAPEAGADHTPRARPVVEIEAAGERAALAVERLVGVATVVVTALPAGVTAHPIVAGASLDARGDPELVLDPAALVAAARARPAAAKPGVAKPGVAGMGHAAPPRARRPVLVIDDSLTTRMLEQSILESAGFEVDLATSAEEGLALGRARRYGLFVVDVEMPGMSGYEFVAATRKDPELSRTPAILVTSRGSPDDLRRGVQAGALGTIVKGEFDQERLLATVREHCA